METISNFYFIFFSECFSNRRDTHTHHLPSQKANLKVCLKEKEKVMIVEGIWVNPLLPVHLDLSGLLNGWVERDY